MTGPRTWWRRWMRRSRTHSPWVVHFDCGGCNGCDIEILDALTPVHSAERFGVINVGDPRQGDVLMVTGPANARNAAVLRNTYEQMAEPKAVIAVGACTAYGGIFHGAPNILGGVHEIVPVDVHVPGCPPRPEAILGAVLRGAAALAETRPADRRSAPALVRDARAELDQPAGGPPVTDERPSRPSTPAWEADR
jgi:ech hydrogenase subunit C